MKGPIVLLTDFGLCDHYVGVLHGVLASLAPEARVIDLCHEVPPQDVRAGAFRLRAAAPFFPAGSIFVCVVDPGVGSGRRILWARGETGRQYLAPDNGLLGWVAEPLAQVRSVDNPAWRLPQVSCTFHGRDVFAPAAARLWRGQPAEELGPVVSEWTKLAWPRAEIVAVDRFGNAVTSVPAGPRGLVFRGKRFPVKDHYAAVAPGKPAAVAGSSGLLELSVRDGSFARRYRVKVGEPVESRD